MQYKIFGCKVNKYYTDEWINSEYLKDKKGMFIASCVVTDKAKKKWLKFVKDITKDEIFSKNKDSKIYISGCGAFKHGEAQNDFFDIYPELSELKGKIEILGEKPEELKKEIIGSKEVSKKPLSGILSPYQEKETSIKEKLKNIPQIYTKKFLLIQGGCNSFCTFCLTVKKRGKHYYRDKEDIVQEIIDFENIGGKEVVLTGVNLSAWGLDTTNDIGKSRFAELLRYILNNTSIPRIRISSMGPEFIDDKCLEIFKETRIYPHFHYSVQSGSSNVLKAMHRHYNGKYMRDLLEKTKNLKRKDGIEVSIGADLIVGFPGESEEDFLATYNLVKDGLITKIHAFPFSPHTTGETVPAGSFPNQISDQIKKDRMWRLEEIGEYTRDKFIERNIGKEFEVLVEVVKEEPKSITSPLHSKVLHLKSKEEINGNKVKWKGWTKNYIDVDESNFEIKSGIIKRNEIVTGKLIK